MNSLINNSEHLLLIMHNAKSYEFFRVSSSTAMEWLLSHDLNAESARMADETLATRHNTSHGYGGSKVRKFASHNS